MSNSALPQPGSPTWGGGPPPKQRRNWKLVGGVTAGILVIGGIGSACDDDKTGGSGSPTTPATGGSPTAVDETRTVPDFVGMGLQSAQDTAQEAGFYDLKSHDSLGRDRHQILDRDWKVCSQNVKAGTGVATDTKLDFGAVKLDETCPTEDQAAPSEAGGTMPDFKGKSVQAARDALDSSTSITVDDASGDGRLVLIGSNWQVCSQQPVAGAKLSGQPVVFGAVKFGESCP
ncbi:PASTA domain-containing protein [Streptomyces sp. NPDC092369]|uniref:PASTA domain-containing protein n=1 Tax=Streptomyces sp. NPDC092369 TaxID=3366015 RepID=UPI00382AC2BD